MEIDDRKTGCILIKKRSGSFNFIKCKIEPSAFFFIIRFQQSYHLIHQKLLVVFLLQKSQRCQHQIFQLNHLVGLPAKIHKIFPVLVQDPDPDQMYRNPFLLYCYRCYLLLYQRMYSLTFWTDEQQEVLLQYQQSQVQLSIWLIISIL